VPHSDSSKQVSYAQLAYSSKQVVSQLYDVADVQFTVE